MKRIAPILSFLFTVLMVSYCGKNEVQDKADNVNKRELAVQSDTAKLLQDTITTVSSIQVTKPKVTFVELGSVNCIPCRMMQPVMKAIEEEFGDQVEIVFHDVWKDRAPAEKYRIRVIPTQVFLDEKGEEFYRHEGFLPKEEIEKLLIDRGLTKIEKKM